MNTFYIQGIVLGLSAAVVPSPFKVFLISQALKNGWQRTLPAILVPLVTDGPIMLLMLFVLNQVPEWFLGGIQFAGGLFILYLSWRLFKLIRAGRAKFEASESAARQSFVQALFINVLNPNPYLISGLVLAPLAVQAAQTRGSWVFGALVLAGFYAVFMVGLSILVVAFGTLGKIDPKLNETLNVIAVSALAILGFYQLWLAVSRLMTAGYL